MKSRAFLISGIRTTTALILTLGIGLGPALFTRAALAQNNSMCNDSERNLYSSMLQNGFYDSYEDVGFYIDYPQNLPMTPLTIINSTVVIRGYNGMIHTRSSNAGPLLPNPAYWNKEGNFGFKYAYIQTKIITAHRNHPRYAYWVWNGEDWIYKMNLPEKYKATFWSNVPNCNADWRSIEKEASK